MLRAWPNSVPYKEEVLSSDVQVRITLRVLLLLLRPLFWMFAAEGEVCWAVYPDQYDRRQEPGDKANCSPDTTAYD